MNDYSVYVKSDGTILNKVDVFAAANGNGSTRNVLVTAYGTEYVKYALYKKPNGLSPERYLMLEAGTESVDVGGGVYETWYKYTNIIPSPVFDIESSVTQNVTGQYEIWYFEPEDGFLGIVQASASLTTTFPSAIEGDFARVVDTNTDWRYLSGVWTDLEDTVVGSESRIPTETYDIPIDPSIDTGLPTVAPDNTEIIINELNAKASKTFVADNYINQDVTLYPAKDDVVADDLVPINDAITGQMKYTTLGDAVGGLGTMLEEDYAKLGITDVVDTARNLSDGITTLTYEQIQNFVNGSFGITVRNETGATIIKGKAVYPVGSTVDGKILIDYADGRFSDKSLLCAITSEDIENNTDGTVVKLGKISGVDTTGFLSAPNVLYLSCNGSGDLTNTRPDDGAYAIVMGFATKIDATEGIINVDVNTTELTVEVTDTNGFPPNERFKTTLSIDELTRTFSVTPISDYHYYQLGIKYDKTITQNVVFSDIEGIHVIYYEGETLTCLSNPTALQFQEIVVTRTFVSVFYWDQVNQVVLNGISDERHAISMSPETHLYLHNTLGTQYISGMSIGDINADGLGSLNTSLEFSISSGIMRDEDISHNLTTKLVTDSIGLYGFTGINMDFRLLSENPYGLVNGAGLPYWNQNNGGTWQLTETTDKDYVLVHYFANNNVDKTKPNYFAMLGQNTYLSKADAREGANTEITTLNTGQLPFPEFVAIGTIIYECRNTYTNAHKARIVTTDDGADYIDFRRNKITGVGAVVNDHRNLTNTDSLDSHPAIAISYDGSSGFTGKTNVQEGLDQAKVEIDANVVVTNGKADIYKAVVSGTTITIDSVEDNDYAIKTLQILGTTTQDGTGNPSPTNQREIHGVGVLQGDETYTISFDVTDSDLNVTTISVSGLNNQLYEGDSIDFVTGVLTRVKQAYILKGEVTPLYSAAGGFDRYRIPLSLPTQSSFSIGYCDRFLFNGVPITSNGTDLSMAVYNGQVYIRYDAITSGNDLKVWLAANNTKLVYSLLVPTTEIVTVTGSLAGTKVIDSDNVINLTYAKSITDEFDNLSLITDSIINLKKYAVGDGVTDDSDSIQVALDLAEGKTLYIPEGDYLISKGLIIRSKTKIIGSGKKSKFKLADGYLVINLNDILWRDTRYCYSIFTTEDNAVDVILKDFSLEGSLTDIRGDRIWGITINNSSDVIVDNVNVSYINYDGTISSSSGGLPGIGLFIFNSSNVKVTRGVYEYCGYENIGGEYCNDVVIDNVYCGTAWRVPLQFHQGAHNIKITNNTIKSLDCTKTHSLITLHGREDDGRNDCVIDVLIQGNYLEGITDATVVDRGGLQTVQGNEENIKVINNTFNCSNECIHNASDLQEGNFVTGGWFIEGNKMIGLKGVTILADNVICKNNVIDTTGQAIAVTSTSKIVSDNLFIDNSTVT